MTTSLVHQLHFARTELLRALDGLSEEDAARRLPPVNCISWMVGHLANQEARYWVMFAQGDTEFSTLKDLVGYGSPATTPSLAEMLALWRVITARADDFLNTLTPTRQLEFLTWREKKMPESTGTLLQRVTYHYFYHIGEAQAVRQMLGHTNLPEFIGDFDGYAYRLESAEA